MAKKFPNDEFDFVTPGGGRHRARRTKRDRVREFVRVLVAAAAVAGLGLFGLRILDSGVKFDISTAPTTSSVVNLTTVGVTVLDSTDAAGLASKVAHKLLDAGWNVLTADNLSDGTKHETTIVYISDEANRSEAKRLLKTLGKFAIETSDAYSDPITVVLGPDFK